MKRTDWKGLLPDFRVATAAAMLRRTGASRPRAHEDQTLIAAGDGDAVRRLSGAAHAELAPRLGGRASGIGGDVSLVGVP